MSITPNTEIIFKNESILIALDNHLKYIYVEWLRHVGSEEFRQLFSEAAVLAVENKSQLWLSDARAIHFIDFADQNWVLREMTPLLLKSSLVKFARVSNKESVALLDVHRVYTEMKSSPSDINTEIEVFLTKEDALQWLFADVS